MGKGFLTAGTGIPTEVADTIIATIIYFTATNVILASFWNSIFKKDFEKDELALSLALSSKYGENPPKLETLENSEKRELIKIGKELIRSAKNNKEVK